MRRFALILVFLYGGTAAAQTGGQSSANAREQTVLHLFAEAARDVRLRHYSAAIGEYKAILAVQPESAAALNNLGIAYHLAGQYSDAIETLQRALRLNPNLLPAYLILGIDYVRLGRLRDALAPLRIVLSRDPGSRDALLATASAYFGLNDFHAAAKVYLDEVGRREHDGQAWYGAGLCFEHIAEGTMRRMHKLASDSRYYNRLLGEVLTDQGDAILAEEAFCRALAEAGNDDEGLHAALGFTQLRLGLVKEAEAQFRMELQVHPRSLEGDLGLAAVALDSANYSVALSTLCKIDRTDGDFFFNHLQLLVASLSHQVQDRTASFLGHGTPMGCAGVAHMLHEEISSPEANSGFQRAFEISTRSRSQEPVIVSKASGPGSRPDCRDMAVSGSRGSFQAELRRARFALASGRYFLTLEAAKFALKQKPGSITALYYQAEAARKLAKASFEKAVQLEPDSWEANILVGDIYRQRRQYDEALQRYEEAAKANPSVPASYLGMATCYWQTGKFDQATVELRKVLGLDPYNMQANFELGDIYVRRHEFTKAIPYLEKTLAEDPDNLVAHGDLGRAWGGMGNVAKAIAELTVAKPSDKQGSIHYQLFLLYQKEGKKDLAQQALARSEQLRNRYEQIRAARLAQAFKAAESEAHGDKREMPPK